MELFESLKIEGDYSNLYKLRVFFWEIQFCFLNLLVYPQMIVKLWDNKYKLKFGIRLHYDWNVQRVDIIIAQLNQPSALFI